MKDLITKTTITKQAHEILKIAENNFCKSKEEREETRKNRKEYKCGMTKEEYKDYLDKLYK